MMRAVDRTIELLATLVSFETVSARSNLDLIEYVRSYLADMGIRSTLSYDRSRTKANLFATVGPEVDGGIVLSGHTDVVPVEGQKWNQNPFTVTRRNGRLYGRGTADMKGFLACILTDAPRFVEAAMERPIHIALSFDEEIGCCGAPILVEQMKACPCKPAIAIVGEPTGMKIVGGHKAGYELTTTITGLGGHASDPARGVNAIVYAARFISHLEQVAAMLGQVPGGPASPFDPPHSTVSVGTIRGGTARNVIAGSCSFAWELRPTPDDDAEAIIQAVDAFARESLLPEMRAVYPRATIETVLEARYPGLAYEGDSEAIRLIRRLSRRNAVYAVPFGSDAGHFQQAGLSTVLFGPGSINQAHKPNEYIAVDQLEACLAFLGRLRDWLSRDHARSNSLPRARGTRADVTVNDN